MGIIIRFIRSSYRKTFYKKTKSLQERICEIYRMQFSESEPDSILLSPEFLKFKLDLKLLRREFWFRDIIIPEFHIKRMEPLPDLNCYIKISGKEVFRGRLDEIRSSEELSGAVGKKIRRYFIEQELLKTINKYDI